MITFRASVYISGISPPTLDCTADVDCMIIESINARLLQRVVAAERFRGSLYGHSGAVLVPKEDTKGSHITDRTRYSCWLARELRLINVSNSLSELSSCVLHARSRYEDCNQKPESELSFVQWYEILVSEVHPFYRVDKSLNCIFLHWERTPGEDDIFSSSRKYELVPHESIGTVVRILPKELFSTSDSCNN